MILLSIVIPFFNTFSRSHKVLARIKKSLQTYTDVEFILVDDGSSDDTFMHLQDTFIDDDHSLLTIVSQNNKGPGGARNTGLSLAKGEYIWFIDSDDDFYIDDIYSDLQPNAAWDFIDFNYIENNVVINSMSIEAGEYTTNEVNLYETLGRIWTKIFKRNVFIHNKIKYPEMCIYEDNYLIYVLPFYLMKFKKSEKIAYCYDLSVSSVTREIGVSIRYYDRLLTSYQGLVFLRDNGALLGNIIIQNRFKEIFLYKTIEHLFYKREFKAFGKVFFILCTYNYLVKKFYFEPNGMPKNKKERIINFLRYFLPSINCIAYFEKLNKKAWDADE